MFWALPRTQPRTGGGELRRNLRSANCLVVLQLLHQMRTTSRRRLLLIGAEKGKQRGTETIAIWCRRREGGGWGTAFVENDSFFHCVCSNNFPYIYIHIIQYTLYFMMYTAHPHLLVTSAIRSLLFDSPLPPSLRSRGRPILLK